MAKLAIKGHATRGKEVIAILEMLGGVNQSNLDGNTDAWYMLKDTGVIRWREWIIGEKGFTLEEFHEKFPYKVGDKVLLNGVVKTIKQACWDNTENEVIYKLETNVRGFSEEYYVHHYDLQPYKMEVTKEFYNKYCVNCGSQRCTAEGEWLEECRHYKEETMEEIKIDIPKGYEFAGVDDDEQQVVFTKILSRYPKTYEECCDVLNIDVSRTIEHSEDCPFYKDITCYENNLLSRLAYLRKLFVCREAYWKIAGEEMGLGKPWEPDLVNAIYTCTIICRSNKIVKDAGFDADNRILAFPTEEMRDAFYENFKGLINETKELL